MLNIKKVQKYQNKCQKKKHYIGYYLDILNIDICIKDLIKHFNSTRITIKQSDLRNSISMYKEHYEKKGFTIDIKECPLDSEIFLLIKWG